jgi:hypothetical protein
VAPVSTSPPFAQSDPLSNLVFDELDRELERRNHRFARYADDLVPRAKGPKGPEVRNCFTDEGRPLGTGLQEQVPNRLWRLWATTMVVSADGATQVRRLRDRHGGTLRGKHPHRDLQSLTSWIHDNNRTVAPLGVANSPENSVAERMERIEDLYARIFRAQGIVGADGSIRTFTAPFQRADCLRTIAAGYGPAILSSCR